MEARVFPFDQRKLITKGKEELVFRGKVVFGDEERWAEITLTNAQDTLLGTGLLAESVLTTDFVDRTLEVERK
jgi:hypothetical protein